MIEPGQKRFRKRINSRFIIVPLSKELGHDWLCAEFMVVEHGTGFLAGAQIVPYSDEELNEFELVGETLTKEEYEQMIKAQTIEPDKGKNRRIKGRL